MPDDKDTIEIACGVIGDVEKVKVLLVRKGEHLAVTPAVIQYRTGEPVRFMTNAFAVSHIKTGYRALHVDLNFDEALDALDELESSGFPWDQVNTQMSLNDVLKIYPAETRRVLKIRAKYDPLNLFDD